MHPRLSRLTATAAVSAAVAATALAAPAAQAAHHHHHHGSAAVVRPGIYDCTAYNGTFFSYLGSYEFTTPGHYALSMLHKHHKLYGKIDHGTYRMRGRNVIPTSGPMKRDHFHMHVKNRHELLLELDSGHGVATGCFWSKL